MYFFVNNKLFRLPNMYNDVVYRKINIMKYSAIYKDINRLWSITLRQTTMQLSAIRFN